jgi:PBP1b-binding outer membrane lipoprotein LpoB
MKKTILFLALFLAACSSTPAGVVEEFLRALTAKDEARLLTLVCADYELDALLEFDSYGLVETTLKDMDCTSSDADVICTGSIEASYGDEVRSFDLSERTYHLVQDGGDWLVCGYDR